MVGWFGMTLDESTPFEESTEQASQEAAGKIVRDLLVFEFAGAMYAVDAVHVDDVIPWRTPIPLPRSERHILGVVQDRGRIVVVLASPTASGEEGTGGTATRILVCSTRRGCVGLPASATRAVGPVEMTQVPSPRAVLDTSAGVLTYLDPTKYADGELRHEPRRHKGGD
jgi:chemotaxis signal transduction protein